MKRMILITTASLMIGLVVLFFIFELYTSRLKLPGCSDDGKIIILGFKFPVFNDFNCGCSDCVGDQFSVERKTVIPKKNQQGFLSAIIVVDLSSQDDARRRPVLIYQQKPGGYRMIGRPSDTTEFVLYDDDLLLYKNENAVEIENFYSSLYVDKQTKEFIGSLQIPELIDEIQALWESQREKQKKQQTVQYEPYYLNSGSHVLYYFENGVMKKFELYGGYVLSDETDPRMKAYNAFNKLQNYSHSKTQPWQPNKFVIDAVNASIGNGIDWPSDWPKLNVTHWNDNKYRYIIVLDFEHYKKFMNHELYKGIKIDGGAREVFYRFLFLGKEFERIQNKL